MPIPLLYDITDHPLLSDAYTRLATDEAREANQVLAEMLLGLKAPAYAGEAAERLGYAVVIQINFQLQHGIEPAVLKSVSNTHPGNTTSYRDRYVDPMAWKIVEEVTGVVTVGFKAPGIGA